MATNSAPALVRKVDEPRVGIVERAVLALAKRFGYEVQKARKTQALYASALRTNITPGTPKRGAKLLRNFAENNEWLRGAINRRKHTLGRARFHIVRTDDPKKPPNPKVVAKVNDLFKNVNKERESFRSLIDKVVEDFIVLDAGCIEKVRTAGGEISELYAVDGASIAVNPRWTAANESEPRYYQYDQNRQIAALKNADLIYMMANPRTHSPIGWSPVETLVRTIEASLYADSYDFEMLKQNAPEGLLDLGRGVPSEQVTEFREYYSNEIQGTKDLAIWGGGGDDSVGGGPKFIQFKGTDSSGRQAYKTWLVTMIAFVLEMDKTAFNLTDTANRASASVTSAKTDEGLVGLATIVQEFIEREIVWEIDENHGFEFTDIITRDEIAQSKIDAAYLQAGVVTVNEIRAREGQDAVPWGDKPFALPQGGTPLDADGVQQEAPPPVDPNAPGGGAPGGGDIEDENPDEPHNAKGAVPGLGISPFRLRAVHKKTSPNADREVRLARKLTDLIGRERSRLTRAWGDAASQLGALADDAFGEAGKSAVTKAPKKIDRKKARAITDGIEIINDAAYVDAARWGVEAVRGQKSDSNWETLGRMRRDQTVPYVAPAMRRVADSFSDEVDSLLQHPDLASEIDAFDKAVQAKLDALGSDVVRYAEPPWGSGYIAYGQTLGGFDVLMDWVLDDDVEHCTGDGLTCEDIAAGGPYAVGDLPTWPKDCDTPCMDRCYCSIQADPDSWATAFGGEGD